MDGKPLAASLNNMDTPFILAPRPRADSSHTGSARSTVPQSLLISASPTRTMSSSLEAEVLSNRHKRQQSTAKSHHHQQQQHQEQQQQSDADIVARRSGFSSGEAMIIQQQEEIYY